MVDWQSAEGSRRGRDLEREQAETSHQQPAVTGEPDDTFELIEPWAPETEDFELELGVGGTCNECDTDLVEDPDDNHVGRLRCPDCALVVGAVLRFPSTTDGGEPSDEIVDWPFERDEWEIEDGRATITYGLRGTHTTCGAQFTENTRESKVGVPVLACSDCGAQLGYAAQMNVLADPVHGGD